MTVLGLVLVVLGMALYSLPEPGVFNSLTAIGATLSSAGVILIWVNRRGGPRDNKEK